AALHVFAPQVALALQGAQVIVDAVRRADPHVLADLAEGRRIPAVADRLPDELEGLLLALGQTLHRSQILLNGCQAVKFLADPPGTRRIWPSSTPGWPAEGAGELPSMQRGPRVRPERADGVSSARDELISGSGRWASAPEGEPLGP